MKSAPAYRTLWWELVMGLLAITAIWLAVQPDSQGTHLASMAIWAVFVVDYGWRLVRSRRRGEFIRHNLVDLLTILPWDLVRSFRLLRLLRVLRMFRGLGVLWRVSSSLSGILDTNRLGHVLAGTAALVVGAGLVIPHVEPSIQTVPDGIWWSLVTASTVGYGDLAPRTHEGRLIAAILMLVGIGTLGMITGSIATYFMGVRGSDNPHVRHLQRELDRWDRLTTHQRHQLAAILQTLARPEGSTGHSGIQDHGGR
jgi:voltage-gated potassium channel